MILGHLICKLLGHKWRRLTVAERLKHPITTGYFMRICRCCGAERIAKQRKPKLAVKSEKTA